MTTLIEMAGLDLKLLIDFRNSADIEGLSKEIVQDNIKKFEDYAATWVEQYGQLASDVLAPGWRTIDSAPTDGSDYIAYFPKGDGQESTHWHPLPKWNFNDE